ncbi:MAG: ATP-binding protein [Thomasclavelia sp.]|uniref:HAMP domain-containing sensor histidine kinase n=1 Tax=Thomasclavelia sp. TaxID=3025757 RepID=UPI0039A3BD78
MEKVNNLFKKMSLKKALLIITSMIIFFVTILSTLTILITTNLQHKILNTRSITINNTSSTYQVETGIVYKLAPDSYSYGKLSTSNQINYYLTISLMIILPTTYIILGTVLIVKIYYRIKLQVPIKLLKEGIDCIANQDLTFKIPYDSYDELGLLCNTFNDMKDELSKNNQKMWKLLRERKALIASVSHDLRTPITVIKGYLEYLDKALSKHQINEEILKTTINNMYQSSQRLECYVDSIRNIQKIEDIEIIRSEVNFSNFIYLIKKDFELLANKYRKNLVIHDKTKSKTIHIDKNMILKALENILNNAFRFATNKITLIILETDDYLNFIIQDDGSGFSEEDVINGTSLFYSSSLNKGDFGIGLSICKIICEKHDGQVKLANNSSKGGTVIMEIKKLSLNNFF